jgi:hypothetical protein
MTGIPRITDRKGTGHDGQASLRDKPVIKNRGKPIKVYAVKRRPIGQ